MTGAKPKKILGDLEPFTKGTIIGCALDLNVPQISFSINGIPVKGLFKDFNVDGLFFPVVSMTACVRWVDGETDAEHLKL